MKWIHVVIPVYNAITFLRETVTSVLNQPYKGIDIVLVEDGSNDGSFELCDEIASVEERVTTIHQSNSGVSAARNRGIEYFLQKNTEGFIVFLDADDLWCPDVITAEVIAQIKEKINVEVFLFGSISCNLHCTAFSHPLIYKERICDGGVGVIWPMEGHFCANLYSVKLLRKWEIRFIDGLKYSEDKIFKMQCMFLAEKVQYLPWILHIYRENSESAMKKIFEYSPIDYYIPIIDGWIKSDDFINSKERESSKHIDAGYTLASIYFGDMAMEHCKQWKSKKELNDMCKSHAYYYLFKNMDSNAVSIKQYQNQQLFFKRPVLWWMKYRFIGVVELFARVLLRVNLVYDYRQAKKYPLRKITANNDVPRMKPGK